MTDCPHDFTERETAVTADGMCPLCIAGEIERLRAIVGPQQDALLKAHAEIETLRAIEAGIDTVWDSLRADNERLRAALQDALALCSVWDDDHPIKQRARRALEGK